MKQIFGFLFVMFLGSVTSVAQWHIYNGSLGSPGYSLAYGVHDTTLFSSSIINGNNEVGRFIPPNQWVASGGFSQGNVTSFASLGRYFFANIYNAQFGYQYTFLSTQNGSNWKEMAGGAYLVSNGGFLVGNYQRFQRTYFSVSRDTGLSWDSVAAFSANILAANGACILASTGSGTWRSIDSGMTWMKASPPSGFSLSAFGAIGTEIFAGGTRVFRSTDSGMNWVPYGPANRTITELAVYRTALFAGTDSGVYVSLDSAANWRCVSDGLPARKGANPKVTAMTVFEDTILFVGIIAGSNGPGFDDFGYDANRPIREMLDTIPAAVAQVSSLKDTLLVYPNPATGLVTILAGGGYAAIERVSVLSVLGVEVLTLDKPGGMSHNSEITLDLSKLPSGTYFLRIQTASSTVQRKVVRE